MNDFHDNDGDDETDNSVSLFNISFDELKPKMTDIYGNGKVNECLCKMYFYKLMIFYIFVFTIICRL